MKALVDRRKCTLCAVCVDVCPFAAITVGETVIDISDECTLCGMCVDTCEFGALSLPEVGTGPAADLAAYKGIWVFAEWREGTVHRVSHELLSAGRILADKLGVPLAAVLLGHSLNEDASRELVAYGADTVYVVDRPELAHFADDTYANVLVQLIRQKKPEVLLAGATSIGTFFHSPGGRFSPNRSHRRLHRTRCQRRGAVASNPSGFRRKCHGNHHLPQ